MALGVGQALVIELQHFHVQLVPLSPVLFCSRLAPQRRRLRGALQPRQKAEQEGVLLLQRLGHHLQLLQHFIGGRRGGVRLGAAVPLGAVVLGHVHRLFALDGALRSRRRCVAAGAGGLIGLFQHAQRIELVQQRLFHKRAPPADLGLGGARPQVELGARRRAHALRTTGRVSERHEGEQWLRATGARRCHRARAFRPCLPASLTVCAAFVFRLPDRSSSREPTSRALTLPCTSAATGCVRKDRAELDLADARPLCEGKGREAGCKT